MPIALENKVSLHSSGNSKIEYFNNGNFPFDMTANQRVVNTSDFDCSIIQCCTIAIQSYNPTSCMLFKLTYNLQCTMLYKRLIYNLEHVKLVVYVHFFLIVCDFFLLLIGQAKEKVNEC